MKIIKQSLKVIDDLVLFLKKGAVIICPTDTVYGFLADATNKKAVDKIFKIKKRSKLKPLPVFVKNIKMAREVAYIDEPAFVPLKSGLRRGKQEKILKKYWPGKYTFILKRKSGVELYGVNKNTIAIRIPKYKFLNDLLKKINKPLVQTSVNISGEPFLIKIGDIKAKFGQLKFKIIIIDAGNLKKSKPSKIIDLTSKNKKILRK